MTLFCFSPSACSVKCCWIRTPEACAIYRNLDVSSFRCYVITLLSVWITHSRVSTYSACPGGPIFLVFSFEICREVLHCVCLFCLAALYDCISFEKGKLDGGLVIFF